MRILIITPDSNKHGNDYSGAFKIEADRFCAKYDKEHTIERCELSYGIDVDNFNIAITSDCDWLVIFCHGGSRWLFKSEFITAKLAAPIAEHITLFACSAAKDEQSPACFFSISERVKWVDGHFNAGHTTSNPNVNRWVSGSNQQLTLALKDAQLYQNWVKNLANRHNNSFRFEFPLQTEAEIIKSLRGF